MANLPKYSGDREQDSWAFQVTRELNDTRSRIENVRQRIRDLPATATLAQVIEILEDL